MHFRRPCGGSFNRPEYGPAWHFQSQLGVRPDGHDTASASSRSATDASVVYVNLDDYSHYTRARTTWVWQTVVPHLVQQHEFLLHSLLSLTAAHMASERSEQSDGGQYRCMALHHCTRSSSIFRQSCSASSTSLPPAPAILVFVILNSLAALSLLPLSSPMNFSRSNSQDLDNFVSWLISLRHAVAFAGLRSSDSKEGGIAK